MRVEGKIRTRPRLWDKSEDSVEVQLRDEAWLVRKERLPGTDDGTPRERDATLGPYPAGISRPERSEAMEPDRWVTSTNLQVTMVCDEEVRERDRLLLREFGRGAKVAYRILETTQEARPEWGGRLVWALTVERTDEY